MHTPQHGSKAGILQSPTLQPLGVPKEPPHARHPSTACSDPSDQCEPMVVLETQAYAMSGASAQKKVF
jgi:hypothetical protein